MENIKKGYQQEHYAPMPTRTTMFWRNFIPWQIIRFIILNLKIIKIVVRGHS
ncbi:MAG: hypothetical protein AB9842_09365 [Bacteroidales bacterium]